MFNILCFVRFYAVMYPLKVSWIRTHTVAVIALIWLFSAVFSSYVLLSTKADPFEWGEHTYYECTESKSKTYSVAAFALAFLLPMIVLANSYFIIAVKLYRRDTPGNMDEQRDQRQHRTKIKVSLSSVFTRPTIAPDLSNVVDIEHFLFCLNKISFLTLLSIDQGLCHSTLLYIDEPAAIIAVHI